MRLPLVAAGLLGLVACSPTVPESGPGFTDYNTYMRAQTASNMAAGAAGAPVTAPLPGAPATAGGFSPEAAMAAIDRAEGVGAPESALVVPPGGAVVAVETVEVVPVPGAPADSTGRARGNAPAGIAETTAEMGAVTTHTGISDENDFQAVAGRETIESDAARIARNRAQYEVIPPTELPERPADTGPNLAQYAISTTNAVGEKVYSRGSIQIGGNACSKYSSADLAQQAFLEAGGPQRDRKGLDPDGDGFACAWDPTPYRLAVQQ